MEKTAYLVGGKEITAYIPKTTNTEHLTHLYDVCNDLFSEWEECFFAKDEVLELRKNPKNKFLKRGTE